MIAPCALKHHEERNLHYLWESHRDWTTYTWSTAWIAIDEICAPRYHRCISTVISNWFATTDSSKWSWWNRLNRIWKIKILLISFNLCIIWVADSHCNFINLSYYSETWFECVDFKNICYINGGFVHDRYFRIGGFESKIVGIYDLKHHYSVLKLK